MMENKDIPQFTFPLLEIANLKDSILKYISETNKPTTSDFVYRELKQEHVPFSDFNEYLKEMDKDDVLHMTEMSGHRNILIITDKGKKHIRFGGYTQECKDDLNSGFQELLEKEKNETKLDLEIQNLRSSISHYRSTRTISIIAIIISAISLSFSIIVYLISRF